ncbi:MAG TPA: TolC family protein [Terriglobia bacterium]|nr:TolC family protein [Terriglobia bacterium]
MIDSSRRCSTAVAILLALVSVGAALGLAADSAGRRVATVGCPDSLPPPSALRDYVRDGKLRLTLEDAIRLTLLNNTDVRLARTPVDQARYSVLAAYHPFDPTLTSMGIDQRTTSPASNTLQGAQTLSQLFQQASVGYAQTFETGTNFQAAFTGSKSDTNSSFFFINPYLTANLNLQVTQPLLRNRGLFPNVAPIRIAQRNLHASEANFEAQVSVAVQQAIGQYWNVVLARESLGVAQESLKEAQATYDHDKRALDLGALPPLDIYRSESQVAQRRVSEIQAEYFLKESEDAFRQVIGADLDPYVRALDIDLVQDPSPQEPLFTTDASTALLEARQHRAEFRAIDEQLASDDINYHLARNANLPDLELTGSYSSQGLGGNQYDTTVSPPALLTPGGFGGALSQLFGWNFPTYSLSLNLNFPIRNRAAQAALGQAAVAKRNDLYLQRREQQSVELDVANSIHNLEQAKLSMAAAKIARDLAQKTVDSEQRKYELGAEQILFVLEAQTELAQAEVALVQAEVSYQMALAAVDHATGSLLDRHHIEIEKALAQNP